MLQLLTSRSHLFSVVSLNYTSRLWFVFSINRRRHAIRKSAVHFHPSLSPDPLSDFPEGLVLRRGVGTTRQSWSRCSFTYPAGSVACRQVARSPLAWEWAGENNQRIHANKTSTKTCTHGKGTVLWSYNIVAHYWAQLTSKHSFIVRHQFDSCPSYSYPLISILKSCFPETQILQSGNSYNSY